MKIWFWRGAAVVVGAAASMFTLVHMSGYGRFNWPVLVVFVMLATCYAIVARRWVLPLVQRMAAGVGGTIMFASLALLAAIALQLVSPFQPRYFPRTFELEVTALARRNVQALGNEVWARVEKADGTPLAANKARLEGGWEQREETLMNPGAVPSTARWMVKVGRGYTLKLTRHPWSGIARIRWQNTDRIVDLYGVEGTQPFVQELRQPLVVPRRDLILKWSAVASDTLLLALAWYLLIARLAGRRARETG